MSYNGLESAIDETTPHLGGSIRGGDPHTWCPRVWDYVLDRFGVESVLDFGSGSGNAALYFHRRGMRVCAVDGLDENVASAVYPTVKHDVTTGPLVSRYDLIHCQEVVEHIEERYVQYLISTFVCAKFVLLTHALPGQTGYHHVNLQPQEYWVKQMAAHGMILLEEDTRRIRVIGQEEGAVFISRSGMIFGNRKRL